MSRVSSAVPGLVFLLAVAATAVFGAQFAPGEWYAAIVKPPWTPPNWVFGPVWTILYIGIAVAGWLVWRRAPRVSVPLVLWVVQLALNAAWSWLFFGLHRTGYAFADILLLLAAIVAFAVASRRLSRGAAWLFLPYGLWVGYAATLNFHIWQNNPI